MCRSSVFIKKTEICCVLLVFIFPDLARSYSTPFLFNIEIIHPR